MLLPLSWLSQCRSSFPVATSHKDIFMSGVPNPAARSLPSGERPIPSTRDLLPLERKPQLFPGPHVPQADPLRAGRGQKLAVRRKPAAQDRFCVTVSCQRVKLLACDAVVQVKIAASISPQCGDRAVRRKVKRMTKAVFHWPERVRGTIGRRSLLVAMSHSMTLLSIADEKSVLPSAANRSEQIMPV